MDMACFNSCQIYMLIVVNITPYHINATSDDVVQKDVENTGILLSSLH